MELQSNIYIVMMMIRKWSWESPDGPTHNLIDYIIVNRKLMGGVRNSRAFPSADVGSDHQLIMVNVRLKLKAKKGTVRTRKINAEALKNEEIKRTFQTRIEQRWELLMTEKVEGIEEEWSKVKSIFQDASEKTLGYRKSTRKWWSGYRREHSSLWTREENTRAGEEKAQTWQNSTTI